VEQVYQNTQRAQVNVYNKLYIHLSWLRVKITNSYFMCKPFHSASPANGPSLQSHRSLRSTGGIGLEAPGKRHRRFVNRVLFKASHSNIARDVYVHERWSLGTEIVRLLDNPIWARLERRTAHFKGVASVVDGLKARPVMVIKWYHVEAR